MEKRGLFVCYLLIFFVLSFGVFANQGFLEIVIGSIPGSVSIINPQNITYNFNIEDNYTIDLNVSNVSFSVDTWWYALLDLKHDEIINDSVIFTPNITFNAVRWNNKLNVYANDSMGNIHNSSVEFYVNVSNSAPLIGDINPIIKECEGLALNYYFNASDVDEDVLNPLIISPIPFYARYFSDYNLTTRTYEIYSGILSKNDAGGVDAGSKLYERTVSVNDGQYSDSALVNIIIIEINNAPVISEPGVETIYTQGDDSRLYKQIAVTDIEDGNQDEEILKFNISILNSTGNKVDLFNITYNGFMDFTANASQVGVYDVTICVNDTGIDNPYEDILVECGQDGSSISVCDSFGLTITNENRAPSIISYSPENLSLNIFGTDILYFNINEYDADGTIPDAYWYVDDVLVEYDSGSLIDELTYNFGCGISGNHKIKAEITDGLLNDFVQWNFSVTNVACPVGISPSGGGGSVIFCEEKWGYSNWNQCRNLKEAYLLGEIDYNINLLIKERCSLFGWDESCGFQIRNASDVNKCETNLFKEGIIRECYYTAIPTCYDGILNCHDEGCEVLIDCGGPCEPCPTCSDREQNQGEEGIDCGGPCPICITEFPLKNKIFVSLLLFFGLLIIFILIAILIAKYFKKEKPRIYSIISWAFLLVLAIGISLLIWFVIRYALYQRVLVYSVLAVLLIGIILIIGVITKHFKQ